MMILVLLAWLYVVMMMALAEALAPQGNVVGAVITFVMYGGLPLALLVYLLAATARQRARFKAAAGGSASGPGEPGPIEQADAGGHAAGDPVAPVGKEP
jgi:hypothetical protein